MLNLRELVDYPTFETQRKATEDGSVMLISYARPRCQACHALSLKLGSLARRAPPNLNIFAVDTVSPGGKEVMQRAHFGKTLTKFPTVSLYAGGNLMYEETVTVSGWKGLIATINYLTGLDCPAEEGSEI